MSTAASTHEKCRHFRGIQNVCGAGVDPKTVRDASQPGPYRWPCLQLIGRPCASDTCAKREWMTAQEHAEHEATMRAAVDRALGLVNAGKCHVCEAQTEPSKVVGRCRYASCGHRIGQVLTEEAE